MVAVLDKFGRIVIPQKLRNEFGFHCGDKLEIKNEGGQLVIGHAAAKPLLKKKGKPLVFTGKASGDIEAAVKDSRLKRARDLSGWTV